jgi:drug/metabolite transporter (DMT)-like permease
VLFSLLAAALLPRLGPVRLSARVCALAVPVLAALALLTGERWAVPTLAEGLALTWLAVAVTVVAFLSWYAALQALGVERAAVFPGLIPVSTVAVAAALGTGSPGKVEVAGALLVCAGVVAGVCGGRAGRSARMPA